MAKTKSSWAWTKPFKAMEKRARAEARERRETEKNEHKAWQAKLKRLTPDRMGGAHERKPTRKRL